jgi:hypothetical protein
MPADAPVPLAAPSRSTVPTAVVIIILALGLLWGVGLFLFGRASAAPSGKPDHETTLIALSGLLRVDQAIARDELTEARHALQQLQLPGEQLGIALTQLRSAAITEREKIASERAQMTSERQQFVTERQQAVAERERLLAEQAAERAAIKAEKDATEKNYRSLPAVAARLATRLSVMERAPFQQAISAAFSSENKSGNNSDVPTPTVIHWQNKAYSCQVQITHPHHQQRVYAVVENVGLLRSDDAGKTWKRGIDALRNVAAQQAFFTHDREPLLMLIGEQVWFFADQDAYFFHE